MVEVQAPFGAAAVHAPMVALVGVQPFAALLDVARNVAPVTLTVVAVALGLAPLVTLPRVGGVIRLSTSHADIMDYWGDESLETAEMPEAAA
jgi:hypothetical protein